MKIEGGKPIVPGQNGGISKAEDEALRKVSRQYEAMFLNQLVGAMRKTVTKGGLVPESQGEKVYQGMLDQEYSQRMAETDQIGLGKLIYEHLLRAQVRR